MKITTWNVNGIRAAAGKGLYEWAESQMPDILGLQEIKAKTDQLSDTMHSFLDYQAFFNPAERPGYSGVAAYVRNIENFEVGYGLGEARFDDEGRVIWVKTDSFRLFIIYFPNGQRGQERVDYKLDFYACLLELTEKLRAQGEQIIITGDFNTAHQEIDLANPKENQKTSGFLPEERAWVQKYLDHGFLDAYRVLYPDRVQYTWWTYRMAARRRNIGWRLDYFLVTPDLMPKVRDVVIHDDVEGSDHCPVTLELDLSK